jgi:hypothetical protein
MQGARKNIKEGRGAEFLVGQLSFDGALGIDAMRHNAIDVTRAQLRNVELVTSTIEGELPDEEFYASAFFNVFLHKGLKQEWKQLEAESGFIDYSVDEFEELLMEFVAAHSPEQDRNDLVNQLRQPTKPKDQSVQAVSYPSCSSTSFQGRIGSFGGDWRSESHRTG